MADLVGGAVALMTSATWPLDGGYLAREPTGR